MLDVGYTRVSFARPPASTFAYKPGKGVKVTEGKAPEKNGATERKGTPGAMPELGAPTFLGTGWDTVAVLKTPEPSAVSPLKAPLRGDGKGGRTNRSEQPDMGAILGGFGKQVSGSFGKGTLFHTRLVNVLLTDDGTVYAGAVDRVRADRRRRRPAMHST